MIAGAVAPSTTASWGNINGDISLQTDLIEYLEENTPMPAIATVGTPGIVQPSSSGNGSLNVYGNSVGTLTAQMPNSSATGGIYVNGITIYAMDGT